MASGVRVDPVNLEEQEILAVNSFRGGMDMTDLLMRVYAGNRNRVRMDVNGINNRGLGLKRDKRDYYYQKNGQTYGCIGGVMCPTDYDRQPQAQQPPPSPVWPSSGAWPYVGGIGGR